MTTLEHLVFLHLSLIPSVGPATIQQVRIAKPDAMAWRDIYTLSAADIQRIFVLSPAKAQAIADGLADRGLLEQELQALAKHQIAWCSILSEEYPILLKEIPIPPAIIYWRGSLPVYHEKTIALVGSRAINEYGRQVVRALVPGLVEQGWHTVSGGALGADSLVHTLTVEHGGTTIAVLGSGILKPYPASNSRLFDAIIEQRGAVVSCFPVQSPAIPGNFPARNRIISGLSRGCLVVQAAAESGALITARYALEQAREVFAVPGSIIDPLSEGCHALLQQGATLVRSVDDIVHEFGYQVISSAYTAKSIQAHQTMHPVEQKIIVDAPHTTHLQPSMMLQEYCRVSPRSFDELLELLGIDEVALRAYLFTLQLDGKVRQNFAGMWES